jgi:hypothetical protein
METNLKLVNNSRLVKNRTLMTLIRQMAER